MHPSPRQNPPSFMSRLPWRPCRWVGIGVAVALAMGATMAAAQPASPSTDRLIRMNGALPVAPGAPAAATEPVDFSIYDQETGGSLLWQETQVLAVDGRGAYTAFLGASTDGLPVELFAGGAARWLSVQRPGGPAATRTLLTAVPYAVSAANADTLAGRPATDYLLTPAARRSRAGTDADPSTPEALDREPDPRVNNGTTGYIGKFFNTVDLDSSALFQSGASIGLNTTTPLDIFHSRFTNAGGTQTGLAVQNLSNSTTAYSGMLFYDHTGVLRQFQGYNNGTGEYRINNISPTGSINFMIGSTSRFQVRNDGDLNISGGIRKGGSLFIRTAPNSGTAVGLDALANDTTQENVAVGYHSLMLKSTGGGASTAVGTDTLASVTTGQQNTAFGYASFKASTGSFNIGLGPFTATNKVTGDLNMYLGYNVANDVNNTENNTIRVGNGFYSRFFVGAVRGVTTGAADAVGVVIDSNGQLGTVNSSRRYKEDIQDMGDASSGLLKLRPVTYRYTQAFADGSKPIDYGLIAEEVEEVYPDLVAHLNNGEVETVQYHKINAMLLNEVQKQHREIDDLKARLASLEHLLSSGKK